MAAYRHRRQVLLFLAAVLLPCVALVGLGVRLVVQERELARARFGEEQRRVATGIGNPNAVSATFGKLRGGSRRVKDGREGRVIGLRAREGAETWEVGGVVAGWDATPGTRRTQLAGQAPRI